MNEVEPNKENSRINICHSGVLTFSPVKSIKSSTLSSKANESHKTNELEVTDKSKKTAKPQTNAPTNNVWSEHQTVAFTTWINFVLQHTTSPVDSHEEAAEAHSEAISIRDLTRHTEMHRNIKKAVVLHRSKDISEPMSAVKAEISQEKLKTREDRDILHDLGLQEAMFGILFSYDLQWLSLALEVVFKKPLPTSLHGNLQRRKNAVKAYVMEHMYSNGAILAQFPEKTALFQSQEKKLRLMLRNHLLESFLELVLLLDTGRTRSLLPVPTLFVRESIYKSTKDVLTSFCRCFLRGEGDLVRHLALIGYKVQFTQQFVDEFDYPVTNLAIDLRDGVRLARLMDLLTKSTRFTEHLRVPAVSRLQKLHNVGLVLNALCRPGEKAIEAKHIVDGHRTITLMLLWKVMCNFELQSLIDPAKVRQEVEAIRKNKSWRRSVYDEDVAANLAVTVRTNKTDGSSHTSDEDTVAEGSAAEEGLASELLAWCQSIAEQHDVPVFNLTSCLADGKALCLLVHYYHPTILPTTSIKKTTANLTDLPAYQNANAQEANKLFQKAINGEKRNYQLLYKACKEIGGVPLMVAEFDSRRVPEEKSMIALLAYLFARLTESSEQVRAAIKLQRKFRAMPRSSPRACPVIAAPALVPELVATTCVSDVEIEVTVESDELSTTLDIMVEITEETLEVTEEVVEEVVVTVEEVVEIEELLVESEDCDTLSDTVSEEVETVSIAVPVVHNTQHLLELAALQASNRALEDQLAEEVRERVKAEMQAKLETEKQMLLALELKVLEVSEEEKVRQLMAACEANDAQKHEHAQMHQEALLAAEALRKAEEVAMRQVAEELRRSKEENERERELALQLKKEREELEAQLRLEQERHAADLERMTAETERLRAEREARILSEAAAEKERAVRAEVELRIQLEVEARLALESRLLVMEEERKAVEAERARKMLEAQATEMGRVHSAKVIQRRFRFRVQQARDHVVLVGMTHLQAVLRGVRARRVARCALLAVQILQSTWRRKQCAKKLIKMIIAATAIQAVWRRFVLKKALCAHAVASTVVSSWWRCHLARLKFKVLKLVTIKLQECFRSRSAATKFSAQTVEQCRQVRLAALESRVRSRSATKIAVFVRHALSQMKRTKASFAIARWYKSLLPLLRVRKLCRGFRRLAAVRRSLKIRRKSSAAVRAVLARIREAELRCKADPSLKLGKQTTAALRVLQTGKMISQLLKACQTLELSTQLSRRCCEAFAQSKASEILFSLLRSCNRSTPHQELLRIALVVLLNVARHDHLAGEVAAANDCTESLVDLMQMFRDKKPLFILATELLVRVVNASATAKSLCNTPIVRKRLEGILHIMERKNRLEVRVRSVGDASKGASAAAGSASPGSQFDKYKGKAYKSIEPITCIQHLMELLAL